MQTVSICMKCRILFSGKNNKNIINLSSTKLAKSGKDEDMSNLLCHFVPSTREWKGTEETAEWKKEIEEDEERMTVQKQKNY